MEEIVLLDDQVVFLPVGFERASDLVDSFFLEPFLGVRPVDFHKPLVQDLELVLDVLLMVVVQLFEESVDVAHHVGEEEHSQELDSHREQILILVDREVISVAERRERGEDPVDARDVHRGPVQRDVFVHEESLEPAIVVFAEVVGPDEVPDAAEYLSDQREQEQEAV